MKVAGEQAVCREVFVEDVEELHEPGGDVFRHGEVSGER